MTRGMHLKNCAIALPLSRGMVAAPLGASWFLLVQDRFGYLLASRGLPIEAQLRCGAVEVLLYTSPAHRVLSV